MQKLSLLNFEETSPIFNSLEKKNICDFLNHKFSFFLKSENFDFQAGYKGDQIQLKLILANHDESFFYPIEAIFVQDDDSNQKLSPHNTALLILEYLELYFNDFFSENREVYLPIDWSMHQHNNVKFFLRGFIRNLKMEKIADEFLSKHGHAEHCIQPISSEF